MLDNETEKVIKPIKMDLNILLGAGLQVGANIPQQKVVDTVSLVVYE